MAQQDIKLENFEDRLKSMELRLANLESELALNKLHQPFVDAEELQTNDSSSLSEAVIDEEKGLESRIGRVGLAWLDKTQDFKTQDSRRELRGLESDIG